MTRTLITGATGLVGRELVNKFERVSITTRNPDLAAAKFRAGTVDIIQWNSVEEPLSLKRFGPFDAVINLMGEPIASGRWNTVKKKRIRDSRVTGTSQLVDAIRQLEKKPTVFVSASAVGFYGDCGDHEINEQAEKGIGFLPDVCEQWEEAAWPVEELGIRLVQLRIGIVLANRGGALQQLLPIFKMGLGGRLGTGNQFFPWIHIHDLVSMIHWAVTNESVRGIYNAVSPNPVTNREFTAILAGLLNRPALLPVPKFALQIALGEFASSLLESQRAIPTAAVREGYQFEFPSLKTALSNLLT